MKRPAVCTKPKRAGEGGSPVPEQTASQREAGGEDPHVLPALRALETAQFGPIRVVP